MNYKILLVCAGGFSTGMLIKKLEAYCQENNDELKITAAGVSSVEKIINDYDIVLVGPQMAYRTEELASYGKPVAAIDSFDYATANCKNILALANQLYGR
ncbi:PTS sugar transporter subunit IIB [Floccifex sp.]|uniref:PTS sugar transporter subunit IIB n=1 Tax=Floccifex sp. TaxID=2815810 RepID=UPI003EF0CF2C